MNEPTSKYKEYIDSAINYWKDKKEWKTYWWEKKRLYTTEYCEWQIQYFNKMKNNAK